MANSTGFENKHVSNCVTITSFYTSGTRQAWVKSFQLGSVSSIKWECSRNFSTFIFWTQIDRQPLLNPYTFRTTTETLSMFKTTVILPASLTHGGTHFICSGRTFLFSTYSMSTSSLFPLLLGVFFPNPWKELIKLFHFI